MDDVVVGKEYTYIDLMVLKKITFEFLLNTQSSGNYILQFLVQEISFFYVFQYIFVSCFFFIPHRFFGFRRSSGFCLVIILTSCVFFFSLSIVWCECVCVCVIELDIYIYEFLFGRYGN